MNSFQATPSFPFAGPDLTRSWIGLKLPSLTIETLLEAQQKNAAALGNANQAVLDGLKTLAQRQGVLWTASVDACTRATSDLMAAESFEERATRQADATRDAYVSIVARMCDLSDVVIEANVTALGIVNARVLEALGELKTLFAPPAPATAAAPPASAVAEPAAALDEAVAAVEAAIGPVEPAPATATAASTIAPEEAAPEAVAPEVAAPEAAAPEAEAVADPTPPPEAVAPDLEAAAAPAPLPRTVARTAAKPARTLPPEASLPKTPPPKASLPKAPPPKAQRRPTSRG